eukprot:318325-Chlamydomonas_euryale.AAC.2
MQVLLWRPPPRLPCPSMIARRACSARSYTDVKNPRPKTNSLQHTTYTLQPTTCNLQPTHYNQSKSHAPCKRGQAHGAPGEGASGPAACMPAPPPSPSP